MQVSIHLKYSGYNLRQLNSAKKNPVNKSDYQYKLANAILKGIPL